MPLLVTAEKEYCNMDIEPVLEKYSVEVSSISSCESSESSCDSPVAKKKVKDGEENDSSECTVKEVSMPATKWL